MADDTNTPLFGTPSVSPNALALRRAQALKMMEQGNEYSPILSKWQGLARVAQSLRGNIEAGMEERSESEARKKQLADILESRKSGDYSKVIANPFTTPDQLRALLETNKPEWKDTGTGITPVGPMSARPVAPTLEKPLQGTAENPPVAIRPSQFGIGQPGQGTPPPVQRPPASGMQPQAGASSFGDRFGAAYGNPPGGPLPPVVGEMREQTAEKTRELMAKKTRLDANAAAWNEDMTAARASPQAIQQLNMIKDLAKTYNPTTGAAAPGLQSLKQAVNGLFGKDVLGETAPQEMLGKINRTLASQLAAGYSKRGMTNMDLETQLNSVPGGMATSNKGTIALADSLIHMKRQEQKLGQEFADFKDPENYMTNRNAWFQKPENALINPLTGKAMGAGDSAQDRIKRFNWSPQRGYEQQQ